MIFTIIFTETLFFGSLFLLFCFWLIINSYIFFVISDDTLVKVTSFLFKDLGELMPKRGEGIKKLVC